MTAIIQTLIQTLQELIMGSLQPILWLAVGSVAVGLAIVFGMAGSIALRVEVALNRWTARR